MAVYERLAGGPGLAGKWKTRTEIGSPGTVSISPSGPDGLTLTYVEEKGTCSAVRRQGLPCERPHVAALGAILPPRREAVRR